jgi:hypothetical protein
MDDSRKHLPYAPYIMYMIERGNKITFPKDVKHEPLHLRPRSEVPARASRHHGSSISAPRVDDPPLRTPSYAPSSSCRHGNGSTIKRVLRSIFCMCKTMVHEVNENRCDIIEMKSEMGLSCDPHHELFEFDDAFVEWDVQAAQGEEEEEAAPTPTARTSTRCSHHTHDDDEETEEDQPLNYREYDADEEEEDDDD